ncbi:MAG: tRNA (adenosine(37)-N6)-threonylcarbamoyltransferase complex dimerization subunit type 1 TsaB [Desulfovibrionaceae bacterium]|nr:tRNA (adenosine(37)-N6)-threonylcarbamoyltransferase complex dimerization subunit type 1 TsaB [Desulfovibrionaceae bacterium]
MRKSYSTGLELVLCACEKELLIVLTDDEELICANVWALQDRATELLAPSLKQMFALAGRSIADVRRIGCVRGPGSFTGTRLVLATAAALRRTTRAQLGALDYLQALATTLAMREQLLYGRRLWILTHARRDLVHAALYQCYGPVIPCYAVQEVRLMSHAEAVAAVTATAEAEPHPVYAAGSALLRAPGLTAELEARGGGRVLTRLLPCPSIDALRLLGRHGDYFPRDVEPLYIRPCDAVENLPSLSERMGRDAGESVRELDRLLAREPVEGTGLES